MKTGLVLMIGQKMGIHDDDAPSETERQRQLRVSEAWRTVMSSLHGRTVVYEIMKELLGTGRAFSSNSKMMAYQLGKKEAGEDLRDRLKKMSKQNYNVMIEENDL